MKFTIRKGWHYSLPLSFGLWYNKRIVERFVEFNYSAKYDLPGDRDDWDLNKLFGIGYLPGHHENSARFGWAFNNITGKVDLCAYCYINGKREYLFMGDVKLNTKILCQIIVYKDQYHFIVADGKYKNYILAEAKVKKHHNKKIGYFLRPYFGGNQTAPHKITIQILKP